MSIWYQSTIFFCDLSHHYSAAEFRKVWKSIIIMPFSPTFFVVVYLLVLICVSCRDISIDPKYLCFCLVSSILCSARSGNLYNNFIFFQVLCSCLFVSADLRFMLWHLHWSLVPLFLFGFQYPLPCIYLNRRLKIVLNCLRDWLLALWI